MFMRLFLLNSRLKRLSRAMLISASIAMVPVAAVASGASLNPVVEEANLTTHQQFAREQLTATIRLYDEHMRVAETGQYLDKVQLDEGKRQSTRSSIASTGAGLMSLVLGAELGVIDDAAEKAAFTLSNLLNKDPEATFSTPRSKSGWYKHFIDAYTGEGLGGSKQVFSTIDTAILGVGAFKVAKYFEQTAATDPAARQAAELARELLNTTDWGQFFVELKSRLRIVGSLCHLMSMWCCRVLVVLSKQSRVELVLQPNSGTLI